MLKAECDGALFGAVSSPSTPTPGYSSPIVALRKKLDLYANVRPVKSVRSTFSKRNPATDRQLDLVIVRENTEDVYVKEERTFEDPNGRGTVAEATKRISAHASARIARMAGGIALRRAAARIGAGAGDNAQAQAQRAPHVTITHKSNVLPGTDGLFRRISRQVLSQAPYQTPTASSPAEPAMPSIRIDEQIIDSLFYHLYLHPETYDVIVAPNLYGDLLSDAAAALVGSLGLVPSANVGDAFVVGEPCHGSAPDIEGRGIANPVAAIRSAALMLDTLGELEAARRIDGAVDAWAADGTVLTPDLGGRAGSDDVLRDIVRRL